MQFLAFLETLRAWAERRQDIVGVAIVGSYARGTARTESDIDVIVITTDPALYLDGHDWLREFGAVRDWRHEDWGAVQSVRVFYEAGGEVEFGIASEGWAAIPVETGTRRVVADGFRIVLERDGSLSRLLAAVNEAGGPRRGEGADARGDALR